VTKVKIDFKDAEKKLRRLKVELKRELPKELNLEIEGSIARGISPVKGFGRLVKYSQSYIKQIKAKQHEGKRVRPVNLFLKGDLMKSLKVKVVGHGIRISFDNFKADIHNRLGAGKSKTIRRMLPTNQGEEFSRSITIRMQGTLKRIAKQIFK